MIRLGFGFGYCLMAGSWTGLYDFPAIRQEKGSGFFEPRLPLNVGLSVRPAVRDPQFARRSTVSTLLIGSAKKSTLSFQHRLMSIVICVSVTVRVLSSFTLCVLTNFSNLG